VEEISDISGISVSYTCFHIGKKLQLTYPSVYTVYPKNHSYLNVFFAWILRVEKCVRVHGEYFEGLNYIQFFTGINYL
jgi:hypothetical protein